MEGRQWPRAPSSLWVIASGSPTIQQGRSNGSWAGPFRPSRRRGDFFRFAPRRIRFGIEFRSKPRKKREAEGGSGRDCRLLVAWGCWRCSSSCPCRGVVDRWPHHQCIKERPRPVSDGYGGSQGAKRMRCSIPDLPEDIWHYIHSLLPLRDAARIACLSRAFLRSWRCHPNLTLSRDMLASKTHGCRGNLSDITDQILRNHSGCLKVLKLVLDDISCSSLDSWLAIAVTPGIEELTLMPFRSKYNLPFSFLSDGVRNSIRFLELGFCTFRPTAELGPMRSLTVLHLRTVGIRGDELECLLSNSLALEQLVLIDCNEIICLKIPCVLQQFNYLEISGCWRLQVIENKAPNLFGFSLTGNTPKVLLGETLQMKNLTLHHPNIVCYARAELPCTMPNLETIALCSTKEVVNTPMLPTKFLYLKHLSVHLMSGLSFSPSYDYFSLVSFLHAAPSLETLILHVSQQCMEHESVFGDSSNFRQMPEHRHGCLKNVKISVFSSAKSLVELTCYILNNAVSLECLTLRTVSGFRCSDEGCRGLHPISKDILKEAPRAAMAIRTYIEGKVPSTVKFTVLGPCRECHGRPDGRHSKIM